MSVDERIATSIDELAADVVETVKKYEVARDAADEARREESRLRNDALNAWKKADAARAKLNEALTARVGGKP